MNCNVKILGKRLYSQSKFGGYSLTRSCSVKFLDAVCGEGTDKSIEKLTERLQAKNILCPIFIFIAAHNLSIRKWEYNIQFLT